LYVIVPRQSLEESIFPENRAGSWLRLSETRVIVSKCGSWRVVRVFGEVLRFGRVAVVSIRDHYERGA